MGWVSKTIDMFYNSCDKFNCILRMVIWNQTQTDDMFSVAPHKCHYNNLEEHRAEGHSFTVTGSIVLENVHIRAEDKQNL